MWPIVYIANRIQISLKLLTIHIQTQSPLFHTIGFKPHAIFIFSFVTSRTYPEDYAFQSFELATRGSPENMDVLAGIVGCVADELAVAQHNWFGPTLAEVAVGVELIGDTPILRKGRLDVD